MRRVRPKVLRMLLTLALLVGTLGGIVIVTESPAYAAYADCGTQRLCAWEHKYGGGTRYEWGGGWRNTCWNLIPSQNDKISAVYNRLSVDVSFHRHSDCTGDKFTIDPGEAVSNGNSPFTWLMNDAISSIRFH